MAYKGAIRIGQREYLPALVNKDCNANHDALWMVRRWELAASDDDYTECQLIVSADVTDLRELASRAIVQGRWA